MCELDLSTLPQRMRYAAEILREADERYGARYSWNPDGIEIVAESWEEQDRAAAEHGAQVAELAADMFAANRKERGRRADAPWSSVCDIYLAIARTLIDDHGWRSA